MASTSTGFFNLFRCFKIFETNNRPQHTIFSCFQFLWNDKNTDQLESKVKLSSDMEPVEVQKEKEYSCVQTCEKCQKIFLLDDIGKYHSTCSICNKKDQEQMIHRKSSTSDLETSGEEIEIETFTNDDQLKIPIQCLSCSKTHHTNLKEYFMDPEFFIYECLDCHIKKVLMTKKPATAFHLAASIVDKEVAKIKDKMWDTVCEISFRNTNAKEERCDRKCAARECKGNSRHQVLCNLCCNQYHTLCVGLPDYGFQYFRCNECREGNRNKEKKLLNESSRSSEENNSFRKPNSAVSTRYKAPEPMVCHICKTRIYYNFDNILDPYELRCLNCKGGTDLMV